MATFNANIFQSNSPQKYQQAGLLNGDLDTYNASSSFWQIRLNDDLGLPQPSGGFDYTFQYNNIHDSSTYSTADYLTESNIPDQITQGFSSSGAPTLRFTSDHVYQLDQHSNEYHQLDPRTSVHVSGNMNSDDIDTNIDGSCDQTLSLEETPFEDKKPTAGSASSPDYTVQDAQSDLATLAAHVHSKRSKKRPQDGQNLTCNEPPCNNRPFSDQTCLTRHLREKHGSDMYYCPISTCNRHRRGFPRRFNLLAHKRRCHPDQASPLSDLLRDSPRPRADGSRGENRLWAKLNELKELRREIDEEIGTLEEAARIMSDYEQ